MFTGLIEGTGKVLEISTDPNRGGVIAVGSLPWKEAVVLGESIATNGVCLTAIEGGGDLFRAEVSVETLARTNLSQLKSGDPVNLERSLRVGDRLGGHMVQGHVDGVSEVLGVEKSGDYWTLCVGLPKTLSRYVVEKGSVAVDGISLTVASLGADHFTVALIPKTWEVTNLHVRKTGDPVNLEVDILAKYVEKMIRGDSGESRITEKFLKEHGYL